MPLKANHLWDRYRKGDQQAFEQLYYQHVNALYDYGLRMTRDAPLVEDCIQDLFSDLWEKRAQMSTVHAVRAYLLVSIKRKIIRKLTHEQKCTLQPCEELGKYPQDFSPDIIESNEEQLAHLTRAFAQLSDKQKEVIYLRFYNQLSYEEIAEVMCVQVKAIYKLMARAIHTLRIQIGTPVLSFFLFVILAV